MPTLDIAANHENASFLSVAGTSSNNVWAVGAQPGVLNTPVVIHWNGNDWTEIETNQLHPMWWVHPFEDGPTFISGGGATVLKVTDQTVERTPTPRFFGNTVYGVWGAEPNDVWAVGGFAGRDGFIWRYNGNDWVEAPLPDDIPRTHDGEIPALFKAWGRNKDDVWFCGGLGTVLHWNGESLSLVPTPTDEQLFTITGNDEEIFVVGGSNNGVFLRGNKADGFVEDTPIGAALLQGVTIDQNDVIYVAGAGGDAYRQYDRDKGWQSVDLNMGNPQSVHAIWADCEGDIWGAGGTVLSPTLDGGLLGAPPNVSLWEPEEVSEPQPTCPNEAIDRVPNGSIARRWIEQAFDSIRRDFPHPPVHARNLHHLSIAIFDAWAAYEEDINGYVHQEQVMENSSESDREIAISYAALRFLQHRFSNAIGGDISLDCFNEFMSKLDLDPNETTTLGNGPIAVGNRTGQAIIDHFLNDGANEINNYEDTTNWETENPVMVIDRPGTNVDNVDVWQLLNLGTAQTQNGLVLDDAIQPYIGPQWRHVTPFALERDPSTNLYSDMGSGAAMANDTEMGNWIIEVLQKTAELDIDDGVMIDIGPGSRGNNTLGSNDGSGHAINPVTNEPYEPNIVKRGDFSRVVAEMWADGPTSETPPGHWVKLAQEVSDNMDPSEMIPWNEGEAVDRLHWDVAFSFSVAAAVHDGAIAAWELKRETVGSRPITLIRWMADNGQRSDPNLPNYHLNGLPLVEGVTELITEESSAPGGKHFHLRWHVGEVAVWSWPGEPGDRSKDHTPLQWMRAKDWIPYQRRTFVTPAFPGFISGHSTFSRSAAVVMAAFTGSDYFPGGMHEFVAGQNDYLKFEEGPSEELRLQWATFFDASDEAGQSRLWGGIHVWPDDKMGRYAGAAAGEKVAEKAKEITQGSQ